MNRFNDIFTWDFNVWKYEKSEHHDLALYIFKEFLKKTSLKIDHNNLELFIKKCRTYYKDNPFHNFPHIIDVTQFSFKLIDDKIFEDKFTELESFALLLSSFCHDLGHPGTTNLFQKTYKTEFVKLYGEVSPLENHHAKLATETINSKEINLLSNFDKQEVKYINDLVLSYILSTDMEFHDTYIEAALEKTKPNTELLGQVVIKCSDISNLTRSFDVAQRWSIALADELCLQGDKEIEKGAKDLAFPLSRDNRIDTTGSQIFFIEKFCLPLFYALSHYFPKSKVLVERLKKNRDYLKSNI
jgi:hypothetical protein